MISRLKSISIVSSRRTIIPEDALHPRDFRLKDGAETEMNKDGSSVAKDYTFAPGPNEIVVVEYVTLLVIDTGVFAPNVFGSLGAALSQGVLLFGKSNGIDIPIITNIKGNTELFQCFGGSQGIPAVGMTTGVFDSADWMGGKYSFEASPFILFGNKGDFITIKVRDNLSAIDVMKSSVRTWQQVE